MQLYEASVTMLEGAILNQEDAQRKLLTQQQPALPKHTSHLVGNQENREPNTSGKPPAVTGQ